MIRIYAWELDEYNEAELAVHHISPEDVMQVLANRYTVKRNKESGSGERRLVGITNGGRFLTLVLVACFIEGTWRPITGWDSSSAEKRWLDE